MTHSKPTIVFVPGMWEGPTIFHAVATLVRAAGFETRVAALASTGTVSPGNPGLADDVVSVRRTLQALVEAGRELVLVLHSAGGFLGSEAMQGFDKRTREGSGLPGGVLKIIFVAAGAVPKGHVHRLPSWVEAKNGAMYTPNLKHLAFNDLADDEAEHWFKTLQTQPIDGFDGTKTTYCGWEDVPSTYIVCTQDAVVSVEAQNKVAKVAGSSLEHIDAGHMPMVSKPEELSRLIVKSASV